MEGSCMPGPKDWLRKAHSDLRSCKKCLLGDDNTLDTAVFHAHQCAEKVLKGYFVFRGLKLTRTHDLESLLVFCYKQDSDFLALTNDIKMLNPYAMYSRYPDDRFFVDRQEAEDALKMATKIFEFVRTKINDSDQTMRLF
jgi:HEPN domain-containing protein